MSREAMQTVIRSDLIRGKHVFMMQSLLTVVGVCIQLIFLTENRGLIYVPNLRPFELSESVFYERKIKENLIDVLLYMS